MTYDSSNPLQAQQAADRVTWLIENRRTFSITEKTPRTIRQNSYLHLLIGLSAMEYGVSLDYAKTMYFKRLVNRDLFVQVVEDEHLGKSEFILSSKSLSKEDMSRAIDRFKQWMRDEGW